MFDWFEVHKKNRELNALVLKLRLQIKHDELDLHYKLFGLRTLSKECADRLERRNKELEELKKHLFIFPPEITVILKQDSAGTR